MQIELSISVSICYFIIYLLVTLVITLHTSCKSPLFNPTTITTAIQTTQKNANRRLNTYHHMINVNRTLNVSIQSVNVGVIIQLLFISTCNRTSDLPINLLNILTLFYSSLTIFILYRIILTFTIYTMIHNIFELFDFCVIKSLYIQSYFYAAPLAFIQLIIVLLYLNFIEEKEFNLYYIPVIAVTFESDSIIFNPHLFNICHILFVRLLLHPFNRYYNSFNFNCISLLYYIFISPICLQLNRLNGSNNSSHRNNEINSPVSPSSIGKGMSSSCCGKVRISNEYLSTSYHYYIQHVVSFA